MSAGKVKPGRLALGRHDHAHRHAVFLAGQEVAHLDGDQFLACGGITRHQAPVLQHLDLEGGGVAHGRHAEEVFSCVKRKGQENQEWDE